MADHLYPTPRHGTKRPRDDDGAAASAGRARVVTPDGDAGVAPTGSVSDRFVPTRGEADVADAFRARCIGGDDALRSALLSPRPAERVLAFRSPGAAVTPTAATPRPVAARRELVATRILDAPDVLDDFYCQLLDWSPRGDALLVALNQTVHVGRDGTGRRGARSLSVFELAEFDACVTAVAWAPAGRHAAVGTDSGTLEVVDVETKEVVRDFTGFNEGRIAAVSWNPATRAARAARRFFFGGGGRSV